MLYTKKTFSCPTAPSKTTQSQWDKIFPPQPPKPKKSGTKKSE